VWLAWLAALCLTAAPARALDVPNLKSHVADPGHLLSKHDRDELNDKLGKVQKDLGVDAVAFIVDGDEQVVSDLGHEAFQKWKVGQDFDNGILFVVPRQGHAHLIQSHASPEFTKEEASKIMRADKLDVSTVERAEAILDAANKIVERKARRRRPVGQAHPMRGVIYLSGALAVLVLAVMLTWNERERSKASA
jgi:hypothetical protein